MIGAEIKRRVRRVTEDAAEGGTVEVVEIVRYEWQCPRCLWSNGKWTDFCQFCSWDRSDHGWLCQCGHLNKRAAEECETCGRARPENLFD